MNEHTPGPWTWDKDGWEAADTSGSVYSGDGENPAIEKYMGLTLRGAGRKAIIPLVIDHWQVEYDGNPISPADRRLIAAAPDMYDWIETVGSITCDDARDDFIANTIDRILADACPSEQPSVD